MDLDRAMTSGYLPKEAPPSFSSASLSGVLQHFGAVPLPNGETYPVQFSLARAGGLRRATEIPNPFSQFALADLCSRNWKNLQRLTARSRISSSRPLKAPPNDLRSLSAKGREDRYELISKMRGARFTLTTDISNFYPSVYTHAVDWAVRGRSRAKNDRTARSVGGRLDLLLRKERGGQTIGIAIGPDTSWLISEILLAKVDQALDIALPSFHSSSLRWVDDMIFYASSHGEAEKALGTYEQILLEYGLTLNPMKTSISGGIKPLTEDWLIRLKQARFRDDVDGHQADDVVDLFSLAFELHEQFPYKGIVSYAIKRCNPFPSGQAWVIYQQFVLASMILEPSCLPHAYDVLLFGKAHGYPLATEDILQICEDLCQYHGPLGHGFEVAWALTILRNLALQPSSTAIAEAIKMEDNMSALLAWDATRKSIALRRLIDVDPLVRRAEDVDSLTTGDWLLSYEARARKWCRTFGSRTLSHWRTLQLRDVRFMVEQTVGPRRRLRRIRPSFLSTWGS